MPFHRRTSPRLSSAAGGCASVDTIDSSIGSNESSTSLVGSQRESLDNEVSLLSLNSSENDTFYASPTKSAKESSSLEITPQLDRLAVTDSPTGPLAAAVAESTDGMINPTLQLKLKKSDELATQLCTNIEIFNGALEKQLFDSELPVFSATLVKDKTRLNAIIKEMGRLVADASSMCGELSEEVHKLRSEKNDDTAAANAKLLEELEGAKAMVAVQDMQFSEVSNCVGKTYSEISEVQKSVAECTACLRQAYQEFEADKAKTQEKLAELESDNQTLKGKLDEAKDGKKESVNEQLIAVNTSLEAENAQLRQQIGSQTRQSLLGDFEKLRVFTSANDSYADKIIFNEQLSKKDKEIERLKAVNIRQEETLKTLQALYSICPQGDIKVWKCLLFVLAAFVLGMGLSSWIWPSASPAHAQCFKGSLPLNRTPQSNGKLQPGEVQQSSTPPFDPASCPPCQEVCKTPEVKYVAASPEPVKSDVSGLYESIAQHQMEVSVRLLMFGKLMSDMPVEQLRTARTLLRQIKNAHTAGDAYIANQESTCETYIKIKDSVKESGSWMWVVVFVLALNLAAAVVYWVVSRNRCYEQTRLESELSDYDQEVTPEKGTLVVPVASHPTMGTQKEFVVAAANDPEAQPSGGKAAMGQTEASARAARYEVPEITSAEATTVSETTSATQESRGRPNQRTSLPRPQQRSISGSRGDPDMQHHFQTHYKQIDRDVDFYFGIERIRTDITLTELTEDTFPNRMMKARTALFKARRELFRTPNTTFKYEENEYDINSPRDLYNDVIKSYNAQYGTRKSFIQDEYE